MSCLQFGVQAWSHGHRLRAAYNGCTPPVHGINVKSAEVQLRNGLACKYSRLDSALTIRSSRDRFAASAVHGNIVFCQGRKAVRLNSGVRCHMNPVQQPTVQSAIRLISAGGVATLLTPLGFKRQGVHFWREANGLTQAVHFQASQWGTRANGSFTINLGISSPVLYSVFTGKEPPKNPATALWPINLRIGQLMPENLDRWWEVSGTSDISSVEAEVLHALKCYAIPYFDRITSIDSLSALVSGEERVPGLPEPQRKMVSAILSHVVGDRSTATAILRSEFLRLHGKPFQVAVSTVASRLGVSLR